MENNTQGSLSDGSMLIRFQWDLNSDTGNLIPPLRNLTGTCINRISEMQCAAINVLRMGADCGDASKAMYPDSVAIDDSCSFSKEGSTLISSCP
ncbi:hypothetical protein, partial [Bacteroides acidifaciens]|uniref:hypothetical protein n=1 Tax=Bacteroides acidifaciens TaxID=85831 RepID=UPI00242FD537